MSLEKSDPTIFNAIRSELQRQQECLVMIPSENHTSMEVMEAAGSVLMNKYSEGYPGKRYYTGNKFIDVVESAAIERAKKLFKVPYANVQPYSGSPANLAIYFAVCKPGDTIMGQNLSDGGHLTHGAEASISGMLFKSVPYHVTPEGYIDIEEVRRLANENKPKLIWIGTTAYSRKLPLKEFADIADSVGAYLVADISHIAGLVVGGAHESPVDYAHIIMTTTHKTLRGPRGAIILVTEKGLKKDPELGDKIDKRVFPGLQGGPHDHQTAGIAVALLAASKPEFAEYAKQIVRNAKALAASLQSNGLKLVTGGTDNHLILIDLTPFGKGMGLFASEALEIAGISTNRNTIPHDPSAFYPSGVRLGTPAVTTRGMKEPEMELIGRLIAEAVREVKDCRLPEDKAARLEYIRKFRGSLETNSRLKGIRSQVLELCKRFPIYNEMKM